MNSERRTEFRAARTGTVENHGCTLLYQLLVLPEQDIQKSRTALSLVYALQDLFQS